jgi:hypothetical protein
MCRVGMIMFPKFKAYIVLKLRLSFIHYHVLNNGSGADLHICYYEDVSHGAANMTRVYPVHCVHMCNNILPQFHVDESI